MPKKRNNKAKAPVQAPPVAIIPADVPAPETPMALYFRQTDTGSPNLKVSVKALKENAVETEQRIQSSVAQERYDYLLDICEQVATLLSQEYSQVLLTQAGVFSESAIKVPKAKNYETARDISHDAHHGIEIALDVTENLEFLAKATKEILATGACVLNVGVTLMLLITDTVAHNIKHKEISIHAARLFKNHSPANLESIFKAISLEIMTAWMHKIPTKDSYTADDIEEWVVFFKDNINTSLYTLSQMHSTLLLQSTFERTLTLTKNQQRQLNMSESNYLIKDHPHVIEVYKILYEGKNQARGYLPI